MKKPVRVRRVLSVVAAAAVALVAAAPWNHTQAQSQGPAAAYALSEGSGTATGDDSGNGHTATLENGVAWTESGRYGNGLAFDGLDDRVEIPSDTSLSPTSAISLSAWVRPEQVESQQIVAKAGVADPVYSLKLHSSGHVAGQLEVGGQVHYVASEVAYLTDEWTHVALTYDGAAIRLYVDGVLEASEPATGAIATSSGPLLLGGLASGEFLRGRIDEVRVYSRALSADEIWADMFGPLDPEYPLTVTFQEPAANARVLTTTTLAATFSRPMQATSLSGTTLHLRDSALQVVQTSVTYDASRHRARVTPLMPLTPGVTYTLTVDGGAAGVTASDGARMTDDVAWSITVAGVDGAPVAAWDFDDASGAIARDVTGNGNAAALLGGAGWTAESHAGTAIQFDGVESSVQAPDSHTLNPRGAMTIALWMRPARVASEYLVNKEGAYGIKLQGGVPTALFRIGTETHAVAGSTAYAVSQWTHVAATYDGSTIRVYVNGVEDAAEAAPGSLATTSRPLHVSGDGFEHFFQGELDDVRIYDRALTAAEVAAAMANTVGDVSPPAVVSTAPVADAIDVPLTTDVVATFSEPLDGTTVNGSTFQLRNPSEVTQPAGVTYDFVTRTVTLNPTGALEPGVQYHVVVRGGGAGARVKDLAGNALLADYTWAFRTVTGTVTPSRIDVAPRGASLATGGQQQFTATATYPDGTTANVTATAVWTTTASAVGTINGGLATAAGPGLATITASVGAVSGTAELQVANGTPLPRNPSWIAPPRDLTTSTTANPFGFLYTGTDPIQEGVAAGAIDPRRAGVIRGRVLDTSGAPLPGVTITLLDYAEYGSTKTRADGMFDIAVNGGDTLTVEYTRAGYLPLQRTLPVPRGDFAVAPEVRLTALDGATTIVDLTAGSTGKVARASTVTDSDGSRRATLVIPDSGVTARFRMPDGSLSSPHAQLTFRATEYTVGPGGPAAMPGALPPTSAYTYAVELTADEAVAAGATTVEFSAPLAFYVENFLGLPVGTPVPSGYYDRAKAGWVAIPNGRVVRVLSVDAQGRAVLDVDGSGDPATTATLAALGIADAERAHVGSTRLMKPFGGCRFRTFRRSTSITPRASCSAPTRDRPRSRIFAPGINSATMRVRRAAPSLSARTRPSARNCH